MCRLRLPKWLITSIHMNSYFRSGMWTFAPQSFMANSAPLVFFIIDAVKFKINELWFRKSDLWGGIKTENYVTFFPFDEIWMFEAQLSIKIYYVIRFAFSRFIPSMTQLICFYSEKLFALHKKTFWKLRFPTLGETPPQIHLHSDSKIS